MRTKVTSGSPAGVTARLILLGLAAALPACRPDAPADEAVLGVFGQLGIAPGDFSYPRAITVDPQGRVFVADKTGRIQRFNSEGKYETGWVMPEYQSGKPVGLYAHSDGRVFVPDTHYHRVLVYDADGHELARFGTVGRGDGQFELPTDVRVAGDGSILVSEYGGNDRLTRWSPDYRFLGTVIGGEERDVAGHPLRRPAALDLAADGTLWVADACNHRILHLSQDGRVLCVWGEMGREPGKLRYPYDLACLPDGGVLVCEFGNDRVQWFDPDGRSRRVWGGQGREPGHLWAPWGVACGPGARAYVVDSLNARVQIVQQ